MKNRIKREGVRLFTCSDDHSSGNTKVLVPSVVPTPDHHSPLCPTVGKPIEVQKTPHPSQKEVDRLYQCYMKELENLFEAHLQKAQMTLGRVEGGAGVYVNKNVI